MTSALERLRALRPRQTQPVIVTREAVADAVAAILAKATKERAFYGEPPNSEATKLTKPPPPSEGEGFVSFVSGNAGCVAKNTTQETPAPSDDAERWRYMFEERAAIREYDGGLCRAEAEVRAVLGLAP